MSTLTAEQKIDPLLAQLQSATEGGRVLDLLVAEAVGNHSSASFPHYTTNLQDAVSLVPEGADLTIEIASFQNAAWLKLPGRPAYSDYNTKRPIALVVCSAIIKAHESKEAEAA